MSAFFKLSIFVAILSSIILLIFPDISKYSFSFINHLIAKYGKNSLKEHGSSPRKSCLSMNEQLFTKDQLSRYDGTGDSLGLYLSFLGVVYDVSKGAQHYAPGKGYGFFAGKDATKAFITGDFTESGLTDDLTGLDIESFDGIETWIDLYEKDYKRLGKLIGTYYDSNGCETETLVWVRKQIDENNQIKEQQSEESEVFPFCNSEWSAQTKSGRVWCSRGSGGKERDWIGVPRQLFITEKKKYRCACVRNTGPPTVPALIYEDDPNTDKVNDDKNIGDLNNPRLKPYEGCAPDSFECKIKD